MESNFSTITAATRFYEGGWSDNPDDPGAATMEGIDFATFTAWRKSKSELAPTVDDLKHISADERDAIYGRYFNTMRCSDLPSGVDMVVFDFGFNSGDGRAIKGLQHVVGVAQDGSIGPETLAAVRARRPADLVTALSSYRLAFLRDLTTFGEFGDGWTARVKGIAGRALVLVSGAAPKPAPAPPAPNPADTSADALMAAEQQKLDGEAT